MGKLPASQLGSGNLQFMGGLCLSLKRAFDPKRLEHMFLAVFNQKRRYRLKLDDSVAGKNAGGRRQQDSTQECMILNAACQKILHRRACTTKFLRTKAFTRAHTHREAFTQRSLYTARLLHAETFTQRKVFAQRNYTHTHMRAHTHKYARPRLHT